MKTTPITGNACGTTTGYNRHRRAGQDPCPPCKIAESDRKRRARAALNPGPRREPRLNVAETAEELEFFFSIGQGWGSAMRAVGYTNPASLARRLDRAGRHDLATIFKYQDQAA